MLGPRTYVGLTTAMLADVMAANGGTPPVMTEHFETVFDTPAYDLLRQNICLRAIESITSPDKDVQWTVGSCALDVLAHGRDGVMVFLANVLGEKQQGAINPVSFCSQAVAIVRVRRYVFPTCQIDVCYFKPGVLYIAGTAEPPSAMPGEAVGNPIVAYLTKYCPRVPLPTPLSDRLSPAFTFCSTDPLGGGAFLPIPYTDADDDDA